MKTLSPSTIARLNAQARKLVDSTAVSDIVEACAFVAARVGLTRWVADNDAIVYKGKGLYGGFVCLWIDPPISGEVGFDDQVEWAFYPQFDKPDYVKLP